MVVVMDIKKEILNEIERFEQCGSHLDVVSFVSNLKEILSKNCTSESHKYFSHDFNGDGFKYHDTLEEAKQESEANLDWYRDQVADGKHVNDMGEFSELSYGLVIGSAEHYVDHVVTQDDIDRGETNYEIGTEILSLFFVEAQEQNHENS